MNRLTAISAAALLSGVVMAAGCGSGYIPGGDDAGAEDTDLGGAIRPADGAEVGADAGVDGGDSRSNGDGETEADDEGTGVSGCVADNDGTIERDEIVFDTEADATYLVAQDVQVDTEGRRTEDGRVWDYTSRREGDTETEVQLTPVDDQWFASKFPEAEFTMKLAGDSQELGVFKPTETALLLLGVVSPDGDGTHTEISYEPPIEILKFPLEKGETWRTESEASGLHAVWSPVVRRSWNETYENEVDAEGTLKTPYGTMEVLRVRTRLERESEYWRVPLGTVRTFAFVTECLGTVATIRSDTGEDDVEFDQAEEFRRITK